MRVPTSHVTKTLLDTMRRNKQGSCRFVQLATVKPGGRPAVRTVVQRGFVEALSDHIVVKFCTDARSSKVKEIAGCRHAEVCWYFPSMEQFRLSGTLKVVADPELGVRSDGPTFDDPALEAIDAAFWSLERDKLWNDGIHPETRASFLRPPPGVEVTDAIKDTTQTTTTAINVGDDDEMMAKKQFVFLGFHVTTIDYLNLNSRTRTIFEAAPAATGESCWTQTDVNP